ncbi:MAG: DUF6174 domain-containing protein [Balneolaceae bacterium]
MNKKYLFIPLLLITMLSSCDNDGVTNNEIDKLEDAIEKWQANKVMDYSFVFQEQCYCANFGKVEIVVLADSIFALKNPETGENFTIETNKGVENLIEVYPDLFVNLDQLFEKLKEATLIADEMEGSYDGQIGYPKLVSIDYYKDAIDDEVTYVISNYRVLSLTKN